jgi:DNA repair exonuclease SbcCD ATPase subunit
MGKVSMAEFQEKVDALGSEVARWEKELQDLREMVDKTRHIREKLHKGDLGSLVFSDILDVAKGFDGAEESFVKRVGMFLNDLSNFRKKLTKFHDNIQASYDYYSDLYQSIPINTKFQELQKLEVDVEKRLKSFQEEVRDAAEEWNKKYSKITNTRDRFREMLSELPLEPEKSMPSIQYAETIDEDIKKIKEAVNKLDFVSFISEGSALKDQCTTIQAKVDSCSSPWDSALTDLIKQLDGKEKSLEQKPAKLERFAQERDFELIWPEQGDKYSPEDHQISDEREDSQVGRGQVIRFVTPGLRRGTEVIVKAGILLAK